MQETRKIIGALLLTVIFVITLGINTEVSAAEQDVQQGRNFDMIEVLPEGIITPFTTWYGTAGTFRVDFMETEKSFSWGMVITGSKEPLVFAGTLDIYTESTGKYNGTVYLTGSGIGRISTVTFPNISLRKGVNYIARAKGAATAPNGKSYTVAPQAYTEGLKFKY